MKELQVNYPWVPDKRKLYELFDDILDRRELTNNKKYVQLFEKKLRESTDTAYAFAMCNGTIALQIAIRSLNILAGEIITTPHSFIASASSILWQNCKPVFVDVEPDTLCINPDLIEEKITEHTKAILAVHIYGSVCNIDAIEQIARKYNLPTIYDGSHAFGVTYQNQSVFNFGAISAVSLQAFKIVSSVEGGVIFCKDKGLADRIHQIRYFGKNADNYEEIIGTNGKMDEFNAAFGLLSLGNLKEEMLVRNNIAKCYIESFSESKNFNCWHTSVIQVLIFAISQSYCRRKKMSIPC
jgi:dTDP-4-amino-4,6-dideoxygalactose transaminase